MSKKSFILHIDSLSILNKLTPEQKGNLFEAIYQFQLGNEIELDILTEVAFEPFKNQFIRDNDAYNEFIERQKTNGSKGGRPKETQKTQALYEEPKKPKPFLENPSEPKKPNKDNDNKNDNKKDNESKNINDKGKEKKIAPHLFIDSEFYDLEKFKNAFNKTQYELCDLEWYFEIVSNWSASKGAKKIDWIATTKNIMLKDSQENKLKLKNGTTQQQTKHDRRTNPASRFDTSSDTQEGNRITNG